MIHTDVLKKCPNLVIFYHLKYSRKLNLSVRGEKKKVARGWIISLFFSKINKIGLKRGTSGQSLQMPPPSVHWQGRKQPGSAYPPDSLLIILYLPFIEGRLKPFSSSLYDSLN